MKMSSEISWLGMSASGKSCQVGRGGAHPLEVHTSAQCRDDADEAVNARPSRQTDFLILVQTQDEAYGFVCFCRGGGKIILQF